MVGQYQLDTSGLNPDNYIVNELHTVSESHFRDFQFIVMNYSPFYVDRFKVELVVNGATRELLEDVDFSFALSYVAGTRVTGKALYGAITLHNLELNGLLKISYQTLGGTQTLDRTAVLTDLADRAYNPRLTNWEVINGVPVSFPPSPHYQDYSNFYGQEELVQVLGEIRDAILTNSSLTSSEISNFLNNLNTVNAATAVTLRTPRRVSITGDIYTNTEQFDGSNNISLLSTLTETGVIPGEYNKVTVDGKGRVTSGKQLTSILELGITDVYDKLTIDEKLRLLEEKFSELYLYVMSRLKS